MNWKSVLAAALRFLAGPLGGKAKASDAVVIDDISTAAGAAVVLVREIHDRKLDFNDAVAFANGVQQILVDFGIEPGTALELSKVLEKLAPIVYGAYASGIIKGGIPDAFPAGGGPGPYRGR